MLLQLLSHSLTYVTTRMPACSLVVCPNLTRNDLHLYYVNKRFCIVFVAERPMIEKKNILIKKTLYFQPPIQHV